MPAAVGPLPTWLAGTLPRSARGSSLENFDALMAEVCAFFSLYVFSNNTKFVNFS
jgi:hypothetical protein